MRFLPLRLALLLAIGSTLPASTIDATACPATSSTPAVLTLVPDAQASQLFSNSQQPDKFRLQMVGSNILTAKVHFTIVTAKGSTVWSEWFPATQLLDGYGQQPATNAAKEAAITKRFTSFFEQKNFSAAAIGPDASFDADYDGSRAVWQDVKQRKAPGFTYLLGLENTRTLSYVPTKGTAVVVHRCC